MIPRQTNIHVGLRIVAAGCIVLWLLASSYCSIEHLFGDDHHHAEADTIKKTVAHRDSDHLLEAETAEYAPGEASHSQESEDSSHDSHPHDDSDDVCCSSLIATVQIATPFVIAKPVLQPLNFLHLVLEARDPMLAAPKNKSERQARDLDWVFTPGVCLGAAHRSLAPPSLI